MALELKVAPTETHLVPDLAGHDLICQLRKTNMVLYGLFVEVVREFYRFQTPYIIGVPDIRWDPDPQKTGIWIDSELTWNVSHPEFVPAIYIKLGQVQYGGITGEGQPQSGIIDLKDAIYGTRRSARSSVSFVHVGGTPAEACMLCDNTRSYLSDFAFAVRKDFGFTKFYEQGATAIQQYQPDSKEKWQSTAAYALEWQEETSVKLESPILRSVDLYPCVDGVDSIDDPDGFGGLCRIKDYGILSSRQGKPDQSMGGIR